MRSRLVRAATAAIIVLFLVVVPLAAYAYSATFTITETNGTTYAMLPVRVASPNTWLASNGYMEADALDTRVQTLGGTVVPHMVADDKTLAVTAVTGNSQTNLLFTTGNSALSYFKIIPGYGGYITYPEAASLRPGNVFKFTFQDLYLDVSASGVGTTILSKPAALAITVPAVNQLRFIMHAPGTTTVTQAAILNNHYLYAGAKTRAGQRYNAFPGGSLTSMSFWLSKTGLPTGTAYARVRKVSDDSIVGTIGTLDVSTLGGAAVKTTFTTTPFEVPNQDVRFTLEYSGGDAGNYIVVDYNTADTVPGFDTSYTGTTWTDTAANDSRFEIVYYAYGVVTTGATTSGTHTSLVIEGVAGGGGTVSITVDGALIANVGTGGASVNVSAYPWVLMGGAVPYIGQYEERVNGIAVQVFYQQAIVVGTTLPDVSGGGQNGTFVWGTNPAGVTVALGSMVSSSQPLPGQVATTAPPEILPTIATSDWFRDPDVSGALLTNPLRPFVTIMSDSTSLTETQAWRFLGLALVLFLTVATARLVRGHHTITGIVAGASIGGLAALSVFPLWAVVFAIGCILGGAVAERAPAL